MAPGGFTPGKKSGRDQGVFSSLSHPGRPGREEGPDGDAQGKHDHGGVLAGGRNPGGGGHAADPRRKTPRAQGGKILEDICFPARGPGRARARGQKGGKGRATTPTTDKRGSPGGDRRSLAGEGRSVRRSSGAPRRGSRSERAGSASGARLRGDLLRRGVRRHDLPHRAGGPRVAEDRPAARGVHPGGGMARGREQPIHPRYQPAAPQIIRSALRGRSRHALHRRPGGRGRSRRDDCWVHRRGAARAPR